MVMCGDLRGQAAGVREKVATAIVYERICVQKNLGRADGRCAGQMWSLAMIVVCFSHLSP